MTDAQYSTVADLIAATLAAREVIKDLHGATKDLRRDLAETRTARAALAEARTAALADLQRAAIKAGEDVGGLVSGILGEWLLKVTAFVQCPDCGLVQAILTDDGRRCECTTCGHRFPRSAVLLSRLNGGDAAESTSAATPAAAAPTEGTHSR